MLGLTRKTGLVQKGSQMISALSGNSALSLLSMFGRPQQAGGATQTRSAQRPPPPPPPPPQGNGASAKSIFDALMGGDDQTSALDDVLGQLVSGLDQEGDGSLNAKELTSAFQEASGATASDPLAQMVSNIIANLDGNGDQAVSADELKAGVEKLAASGPQGHRGGPPPGPAPAASDAASSLINGLDTDGDGKLSAEELAAAFEAQGQSQTQTTQKSMQELLFGLLLDQKGQDQTAQAAALYTA